MKAIAVILLSVVVIVVFVIVFVRSRQAAFSPSLISPPDDGRLRIRDLTVDDIRFGKNWKVTDPHELLFIGKTLNLEDIHVSETESFSEEDTIAYSAIFVTKDGTVSPLVLIKEVAEIDYGGEYCEVHAGKWRQVGLIPNPNALHGTDYVANPLDQDPSFNTMDNEKDDYRARHRDGFKKWSVKLKSNQPDAAADVDKPRR